MKKYRKIHFEKHTILISERDSWWLGWSRSMRDNSLWTHSNSWRRHSWEEGRYISARE